MARRTVSHRGEAKKITKVIYNENNRKNRIKHELIQYLNGNSNSLDELIEDLSHIKEQIIFRYDGKLIGVNNEGYKLYVNDPRIKQKMDYLLDNIPPVPKSFNKFYKRYEELDELNDKKVLTKSYFSQLPSNVVYYIPTEKKTIRIWKENKTIKYTFIGRKFYNFPKYKKDVVDEILKYANAIKVYKT